MKEPRWVTRRIINDFHQHQLHAHGGIEGIRDENLLESALARPQQKYAYEPDADLFDLGAAYAFGIARNHPFLDGNKRSAFGAMGAFLLGNGYLLEVEEADAISTMQRIAAGNMAETELAAWARRNSEPV